MKLIDSQDGPAPSARLAVNGNDKWQSWLDILVRRYSGALFLFFERRLDQKADVPDLVQDVFFRLARMKGTHDIEKIENYLFKTASNALRDHLRHGQVRQTYHHGLFVPDLHGGVDFSSADILEGKEALDKLNETLRKMPERTRTVFVLKAFEERKTAAIAEALGISERAVEKQYAKALARVSRALVAYRD